MPAVQDSLANIFIGNIMENYYQLLLHENNNHLHSSLH